MPIYSIFERSADRFCLRHRASRIYLSARTVFAISIVLCCLYACKKNNASHLSSGNSVTLSFSTPADSAMELTISETGGKILVDTIFATNGISSANLHTSDTLVDVTTIIKAGGGNQPTSYLVYTHKAVNLARWQTVAPGYYGVSLGLLPVPTIANLTYINSPTIPSSPPTDYSFNSILFSDAPINASSLVTSYSGGAYHYPATIDYEYDQYGNNLDYILFAGAGQYKFHTHSTNSDTVDLTEMETATLINFSRPQEYGTVGSCSLVGYWDTTNYTNSNILYSLTPLQSNNSIADVEYPTEKCQAYELNVFLANSTTSGSSFYSYGSTVPSTLPLPDESAYNLSSSTASLFSLTFAAPKPTYYLTTWEAGNISWVYYAPPDSTTLHPLSTLSALNSKLLQAQDLSSLALYSFSFGIAQGMNYLSFYEYLTNPALLKVKRLPSFISFSKTF